MTMANSTVTSSPRSGVSARKTNKPLMEKRRRARINDSLSQLKSLVIQSSKKDSSQFNKLEKADILELTVKHLRNLQCQQHEQMTTSGDQTSGKYQAGFMECANEVIRYLGQSQGFSDEIKARVIGHLASCIQLANKNTFAKPSVAQGSAPSAMPTAQPTSSAQLPNGQIVHIVSTPFHQVKPHGLNQYPAGTPVQIPSPSSHSLLPKSSPADSVPYIHITQPLHIQIPPVLSPVLVQPKIANKIQQQPVSHMNLKQERTVPATPSPVMKERSLSPAPLPLIKHHIYYPQEEDYMTRSRTYSMTSSSSESEMTSPLNLSQSPQYYDHRRDSTSNYARSKYPQQEYQPITPVMYAKDKLSPEHYKSDSSVYGSHTPPGFTSVIVDGRKGGFMDGSTYKYMSMVMEDERHCSRHEESTSPASSVGEERLWRPW